MSLHLCPGAVAIALKMKMIPKKWFMAQATIA